MSLLEDVFLEDEAGEAQELERIIEGDEYDDRARQESDSDENSEKEDEAEEDKRRVDPASTKAKRVVKNPRFVLNPARLTGPRGISIIPEHFKDFKFKGKGHEKEDLDLVLKKLEHWAYRLYPKFKFEDCLKKIETLGKKRVVSVHLHKIRSDQLVTEDTVVQKDSSDEEELAAPLPEEDEFDQLLQQQIELARATPAHGETRSAFSTPVVDKRSPLMMPKATSSPSISDEQKERMLRNRKIAEERRLDRLKAVSLIGNGNTDSSVDLTNGNIDRNEPTKVTSDVNDETNLSNGTRAKKNRANIIESSDDDDNETVSHAITVDIHRTVYQNTIDLTEGYKQRQESGDDESGHDVDLEITGIENKRNNEDNSDSDNINPTANSVNRNIIDLTEIQGMKNSVISNKMEVEITGTKNKRKNVIDSSDDDSDGHISATKDVPKTVNQNMIDLTEVAAQKSSITSNTSDMEISEIQNKKQNIIDSSDDDDGVLVMNESFVVDIHKRNNNSDESYKDLKDAKENKAKHKQKANVIDDVAKKNVDVDKQTEIEMGTSLNEQNERQFGSDDVMVLPEKSTHTVMLPDIIDMIYVANNDANKENDSKTTDLDKDCEKIDSNHGKVNEVSNDLMDVDFSEDF